MAGFSLTSLYQLPRQCTPKARQVVLDILNSADAPLKTKEIYDLAVQPVVATKPHSRAPPPLNNAVIRSVRYLKTVVLRDLAGQKRIEKVKMGFNTWVWRPKGANRATPPPPKSTESSPALPGSRELSPAAVGVGEDWGHLNKRRQGARERKVERDLERMRDVQKFQSRNALSVRGGGAGPSPNSPRC